MSELTLFLIRMAFLAILWIFVLSAISVIRSDMFGARVPEGARAQASAKPSRSSRSSGKAKPPAKRRGSPTHVLVTEGANAGDGGRGGNSNGTSGGNGGRMEVSGKGSLDFQGCADACAASTVTPALRAFPSSSASSVFARRSSERTISCRLPAMSCSTAEMDLSAFRTCPALRVGRKRAKAGSPRPLP